MLALIAEATERGTSRVIDAAPIHRASASSHASLHKGSRLVPSDERAPTRSPHPTISERVNQWRRGDDNTGAARLAVFGRQRSTRRGLDGGYSAVGELREHLGGLLCFGSHHHPFAIGDHGLHRGDGIEGWQRAAGQRLPHAALEHPRPRAQYGVQLLPYDGVLPPELKRQV